MVKFAGFTITMEDVRPCSHYLEAIHDFPRPRNLTDVISWFGLVKQVAYAFSIAEQVQLFRRILKGDAWIEWTPELEDIFRESEATIIAEIGHGVHIFDKPKTTCVTSDWSKEALGSGYFKSTADACTSYPSAAMGNDGWKIMLVCSQFTHAAESRYVPKVLPIEGEARYFMLPCKDLIFAVDHNHY